MLLIIPVSHVDFNLATLLAKRIASLGQMTGERCLVVASWRAAWHMDSILSVLRPAFGSVEYLKLKMENEEGWPESANHMFYEMCKHLHELGNIEPFYFMEADCVPLGLDWFGALHAQYFDVGKPYMGVINDTRWIDKRTGKKFIKGKHMVGTGIYPADFFTRCRAIHYLGHVPWDVAIEDEVVPECQDTKLIAHRWGTCRYKYVDGIITCEDVDPVNHHYAAPIPPEAVVVHGCKDFSLDKLLSLNDSATSNG